jgi:chromosome segregation ATPase
VDTWTAVVSIGGAILSGGGVAAAVDGVRRWRSVPVDNAVKITDAAMRQVDQLQQRVQDAEETTERTQQRMHEVEQEAEDTRQQLRAVRREAADLAERIATLARWIHDPYMTMEALRARVPAPTGTNGR